MGAVVVQSNHCFICLHKAQTWAPAVDMQLSGNMSQTETNERRHIRQYTLKTHTRPLHRDICSTALLHRCAARWHKTGFTVQEIQLYSSPTCNYQNITNSTFLHPPEDISVLCASPDTVLPVNPPSKLISWSYWCLLNAFIKSNWTINLQAYWQKIKIDESYESFSKQKCSENIL